MPPSDSSPGLSRRKRFAFALIATGLVTTLILLLAEAVLWIAFPISKTPGFSATLQQTIPGCAEEITYARNDLGFRTRDLNTIRKVPGTFRILCLGGSTTDEATKSLEDSWPDLLEQRLRQDWAGPAEATIELAAHGRPGERIRERHLWLRDHLDELDPDMVILLEGINDLCWNGGPDYRWAGIDSLKPGAKSRLKRLVQLTQVGRRLVLAYKGVRTRIGMADGKAVAWQEDLPKQYQRHAERIFEPSPKRGESDPFAEFTEVLDGSLSLLADRGVKTIVLSQVALWTPEMSPEAEDRLWFPVSTPGGVFRTNPDWLATELARWNEAQQRLAETHGATFIDLDGAIPKDLNHYFDDCHFTLLGSRAAADFIAAEIRRTIKAP